MATTKKALVMADELASELKMRLPALTITQSYDTDGSPLIQVGTSGAGNAGGIVKVQPIDWPLGKDILGLASQVYSPHVVKVGLEKNYAGTTDNVADVNTMATILAIIGACVLKGARTEVYQSNNGTAPDATTLADATKLTASFEPSLQYPMISNQ